MRILLSSVGRRGYLVKYFRQALGADGQVWGGDNDRYASAFHNCDRVVVLPRVAEPDYAERLLKLCRENKIDMVIPLIDPELEVLSTQRQRFYDAGIMIVVSPPETIRTCADKYLTYQFARQHEIPVPQTAPGLPEAAELFEQGRLKWPVLVKPRKGSASNNIVLCYSQKYLEAAFESCPMPMIQEFINGTEYGYDLFADKDYRPISVYCKRKLLMRAGETDKAVSTDQADLIELGARITESFELFGPCDADVMVNNEGPKLLELNPRFGGGYPCAHLAGAAFPEKLIDICRGRSVSPDIGSGKAGIYMLKQDEIISPTEARIGSIPDVSG